MTSIYGYLKPGINEKTEQSQRGQLKSAGVSKIYEEKASGSKNNTPKLDRLMADVQAGDTLVVTSLDRIARNTTHLLELMESLSAAGVTFKAINDGIDTSSSHGDEIRRFLGSIVGFERQIARERQSAGIAKAKKEGRYKGRKPTAMAKADQVMALSEQGMTRQKIADELGIGVASVYRILKSASEPKKPARKVVKKPEKVSVEKKKREKRKPARDDGSEQLSFF
jgi:DNA invertase Pin-like site-specific DNA recombinase